MKRWMLAGFAMLTMLLLVTSPALAAQGGKSANAKACQKGGWETLARAEDRGTPFVSQGECVSYGAQGGTLTAYVPAPSAGCAYLASVAPQRLYSWDIPLDFLAGERVTLGATDPLRGATGVQIRFNGVGMSAPGLPAELSYDIPTDGTYWVQIIVLGGSGNALMDVGCSRP